MCGWFPAASGMRTWGWGETCRSAPTSGPLSDRLSPRSPAVWGGEEGPGLQSRLQALSPHPSFLSHLPEARPSPSALGPLPSCDLSSPSRGLLSHSPLPPTSLPQPHLYQAPSPGPSEPTSPSPAVLPLCEAD